MSDQRNPKDQGNILTVAATDSAGNLASFSNYGAKSVDLGAPGDNIYSTHLTSASRSRRPI